jgi:short-subunit dehydrogenase
MTIAGSSVLILGAASDIGLAIAHEFAREKASVILAARSPNRLETDAVDLGVRYPGGAGVTLIEFDVLRTDRHGAFLDGLKRLPDIVVCVVGLLGDQKVTETDPAQAELIFQTNFNAPALMLDAVATRMHSRGAGTIIGISSVAGDRGRASNYIYGSAKAGFTAFLSGLRNRLAKKGVQVITVKPGFVRTKMTAGMKLPNALTAAPQEVGAAVLAACQKKRDVIYVRPVWWVIMTIIRSIPEVIFKRLSL